MLTVQISDALRHVINTNAGANTLEHYASGLLHTHPTMSPPGPIGKKFNLLRLNSKGVNLKLPPNSFIDMLKKNMHLHMLDYIRIALETHPNVVMQIASYRAGLYHAQSKLTYVELRRKEADYVQALQSDAAKFYRKYGRITTRPVAMFSGLIVEVDLEDWQVYISKVRYALEIGHWGSMWCVPMPDWVKDCIDSEMYVHKKLGRYGIPSRYGFIGNRKMLHSPYMLSGTSLNPTSGDFADYYEGNAIALPEEIALERGISPRRYHKFLTKHRAQFEALIPPEGVRHDNPNLQAAIDFLIAHL